MTSSPEIHRGNGSDSDRMVLFIAGDGINSRKAMSNLEKLCNEHLNGRDFEVVDVLEDHSKALEWKILLTPALLVFSGDEPVRITGSLDHGDRVLAALGTRGRAHGA